MVAINATFLLFSLLQLVRISHGSWVPVNPLLKASPATISSGPQRVELSDNGRRMAVGTDNSIAIYDLNNDFPMSWKLTGSLSGSSGKHFSLSPDGRFLASRHGAKQVQVWEIMDNEISPIGGSLWCIADGENVKLGQSSSKLYLAMSCETWNKNRGMVHFFEHDLSSSDIISGNDEWKTFRPYLKGRNEGDRFGTAVSIAEAPSSLSGYSFRVAIGSPGYNENQGMVNIFAGSDTTLPGWEQMGDDLTGSKVGESFGSTLDMSDNINGGQPFLVVGSPEWKKEGLFGVGLARLYNWRRPPNSSLRTPRQWKRVGNPMRGPYNSTGFARSVMISRSSERVAIAVSNVQGSYAAVYERDSYNSWGKIVNNVIFSGDITSNGQQMGQFFAMNDQGSMVATILPDDVVQAFLDDSPFCGVPQDISVFRTLVMRDTCRDGDNLVENKNVCSGQSVFINGEFQACSWNSISITSSPSTAPSTAVPSSVPSSAPTTTPSIELPFVPSMVPSIYTSSFPSTEKPNVPTAAPTAQLAAYGSPAPTSSSVKLSSQPSMAATIESVYLSEAEGDATLPLATNKDTTSVGSLADKPNESSTGNLTGGVAGSIVGLIVVALSIILS